MDNFEMSCNIRTLLSPHAVSCLAMNSMNDDRIHIAFEHLVSFQTVRCGQRENLDGHRQQYASRPKIYF